MKSFATILLACAAALAVGASDGKVAFEEPSFEGSYDLLSTFEGSPALIKHSWEKSANSAFEGQILEVAPGGTKQHPTNDSALVLVKAAQRYGVSAPLQQVHKLGDKRKSLFQYEVAFTEGLTCGGAYMKLVAQQEGGWRPSELTPDTPYSVMFGPDRCGSTNKVHLILKVPNPVSGELTEHHLKDPPAAVGVTDSHTHLYSVTLSADNKYTVSVDNEQLVTGSVLDPAAFDPPLQAPKVIPDPSDKKPADWVDDEEIPDPDAVKPEDWDEDAPRMIPDEDAKKPEGWLDDAPAQVPDPEAEQPEDWDEEEDGEWEPPMIDNPACDAAPGCGAWVRPQIKNPEYKGKWKAPMIKNPDFVGEWRPKEIENPAYFESSGVADLAPVVGAAIEVWTMSGGMQFDNVLLTADGDAAAQWVQDTWVKEHEAQVAASTNAQASARAAARADAWANGAYGQYLLLSLNSLVELAMQHMLLTGATVVLLLGVMLYGCFACCGGDDLDMEGDAGRRAMAEAFAKMEGAGAQGEEAMPADSDSEDDGAGAVQRSAAGVSAAEDAAGDDADQVQGGSDNEEGASAEKED